MPICHVPYRFAALLCIIVVQGMGCSGEDSYERYSAQFGNVGVGMNKSEIQIDGKPITVYVGGGDSDARGACGAGGRAANILLSQQELIEKQKFERSEVYLYEGQSPLPYQIIVGVPFDGMKANDAMYKICGSSQALKNKLFFTTVVNWHQVQSVDLILKEIKKKLDEK